MMELLGRMPKNLAMSGKYSEKYFDSNGQLRRISGLSYWPLINVLTIKYNIKEDEAKALEDFLLPMLRWNHDERATAQQMLQHPWLKMPPNYNYKISKKEMEIKKLKQGLNKAEPEEPVVYTDRYTDDVKKDMNELIESDPEINHADAEEFATDFDGQTRSLWDDVFDSEDSLEPADNH